MAKIFKCVDSAGLRGKSARADLTVNVRGRVAQGPPFSIVTSSALRKLVIQREDFSVCTTGWRTLSDESYEVENGRLAECRDLE
jgi:hypothetical protein